jgi:hypothetical protein
MDTDVFKHKCMSTESGTSGTNENNSNGSLGVV